MKICLAQTKPITGDIQRNINRHTDLIEQSATNGANIIIFPELSLTGYEPTLAKDLATQPDDTRLDIFQTLANDLNLTIGIGIPLQQLTGINIGLLLFHAQKPKQIYAKHYLHADEEPYFISGQNETHTLNHHPKVALAICYEISIPDHVEKASQTSAKIYIASVAKFANGIKSAQERLSKIAQQYGMVTCMSNCIGLSDGGECAGQSAVWDTTGKQIAHLNDHQEGLLIFDSETLSQDNTICIHFA